MLKLSIVWVLLISCLHVKSQHSSSDQPIIENNSFQKDVVGRINFLGVLDGYDHNISLGAEYRFHPEWSVGLDAGYIFQSGYIEENKGVSGIILRPFLRHYFKENRKGFVETHIHFKTVRYKVSDWIGKEVVEGVPSYEEFTTFHYNKKIFGISFIVGRNFNLIKKHDLVKLEPYFGLGIRIKSQRSKNGLYSPRNNLLDIFEPNYNYLGVLTGMRLTVKL